VAIVIDACDCDTAVLAASRMGFEQLLNIPDPLLLERTSAGSRAANCILGLKLWHSQRRGQSYVATDFSL
jgi:hypothetical protein